MPGQTVSRFFLGANSREGFFSLYDDFARPEDGVFLRVVKGGPGCGKSSFMKTIGSRAEQAGLSVEYIHCSGDPDSLDGVFLPEKGVAYADGTAPHVIDPPCPGAGGAYLDLGRFYDETALRPKLGQIMALNREYKALYGEAYARLAAAGSLACPGPIPPEAEAAVRDSAMRSLSRLLKKRDRQGRRTRRFLSAVSCRGQVLLSETLKNGYPRLTLLQNSFGLAPIYLEEAARQAQLRGHDAILCPDCLCPDRLQALLLPEDGLAFLASDAGPLDGVAAHREIRLDETAREGLSKETSALFRKETKHRQALLGEGTAKLAQARKLHDRLEGLYNPHVDFEGVYALADEHARLLGL